MAELDPKLKEAIAFFEQMLQTMPGDRTSLEFLTVAYEKTGDQEKRRDCLIRLAETLLSEKDFDHAQIIAGYLSAYTDYPPAKTAVEHVAEVVQSQILKSQYHREVQGIGETVPPLAGESAADLATAELGLEIHAWSRSASTAEMDLVWLWKEREYLPKDICMDVLHVLTDRPVTDTPVLISALALLDEQHPELTEQVMEVMQRASEIPPIPIELFEVVPTAASLLPSAFIKIKGVLPFATLGDEVLVALLNPMNPALQEETVARIKKPCHFFLAHPRAWLPASEKLT